MEEQAKDAPGAEPAGPPQGSSRTLRKVFDFTVAVENPIHFCTNRGAHLMSALQNQLVGRNFKGAHVVRVLEVLASSAVHIQRTNGTGAGYVDVQVLAEVLVFARWNILVGVVVLANQPMVVGAYTPAGEDPAAPRAAVALAATRATETLAAGQVLAARVVDSRHPPMQPQATVYATLLTCDQAAPVFRLRGSLDRGARAELAPLLAGIEAELAAREELLAGRRADVWFFECLLHPYRARPAGRSRQSEPPEEDLSVAAWPGGPSWEGPPYPVPPGGAGVQLVSAVELVRRAVLDGASVPVAGTWSRPLGLYRSSPLVATAAAGAEPAGWAPAAEGSPRAVFAEFLSNILDHLRATREMPGVYSTPELVDRHANLWAAMRAAQRAPPDAAS